MARIRTIKPDFFRHEGLQDLASQHGAHVMLVFAGLWGHCDRFGRFECKPRHLKLDILPFLDFDMAETLSALECAGFVEVYEVAGKRYGFIPSFTQHQRFNGKEAAEPAKHPEPPVKHSGSNGEALVNEMAQTSQKQEGSNGEAMGKQSPPLEWNKGREYGIGNGVAAQARSIPKATRWKSGDEVPGDWLAEANEIRAKAKLTPVDPALEAARFVDFWAGKSGKDATKADWHATWRNWVRNSRNGVAPNGTGRQPMGPA